MWLLKYLPKNLLSYYVGILVHLPLPRTLSERLIHAFGSYYKINFDEAEKPHSEYPSIGDFFIRKLKPGVRPLGHADILHPADSLISQIGKIRDGKLIQAKGREYSVEDFVKDEEALAKFNRGLFVTYYLCPTDYHRVHSPVSGFIKSATHIPGNLWPVNEWSVHNIENLFPVNERVVVEIETALGVVNLVFVGATNVGKMTMSFDPHLVTNQSDKRETVKNTYAAPIAITKGDELGIFHMGSTVVMLYPESVCRLKDSPEIWQAMWKNKKVKMGENFL